MRKLKPPKTLLWVFGIFAALAACQLIETRDPKDLICPDYHPDYQGDTSCFWPDEVDW